MRMCSECHTDAAQTKGQTAYEYALQGRKPRANPFTICLVTKALQLRVCVRACVCVCVSLTGCTGHAHPEIAAAIRQREHQSTASQPDTPRQEAKANATKRKAKAKAKVTVKAKRKRTEEVTRNVTAIYDWRSHASPLRNSVVVVSAYRVTIRCTHSLQVARQSKRNCVLLSCGVGVKASCHRSPPLHSPHTIIRSPCFVTRREEDLSAATLHRPATTRAQSCAVIGC